jgi:hypothetical protein
LGVSNTTRAAVAGWAKTLSGELARFGITVNNVLPGFTKTSRLDTIIEGRAKAAGRTTDEIVRDMLAVVPAGRFAESWEIAAAIGFLASPAGGYITGISLPVDGGRIASLWRRSVRPMIKILHFIDGNFVEPASGSYFDDVDPAVGAPYAQVPDGDAVDVDRAVAAAKAAFPGWSQTPAAERSRVLLAIADGIEREIDELARIECIDNGKPVALALQRLPRAVANFRFSRPRSSHELRAARRFVGAQLHLRRRWASSPASRRGTSRSIC